MNLSIVLAVICGAVALVGAFCVVFQIYQMTVIDATARGLKHPKFWGVFTMNGNNSSGLLMKTFLILCLVIARITNQSSGNNCCIHYLASSYPFSVL